VLPLLGVGEASGSDTVKHAPRPFAPLGDDPPGRVDHLHEVLVAARDGQHVGKSRSAMLPAMSRDRPAAARDR
jgi:hypothetical protein